MNVLLTTKDFNAPSISSIFYINTTGTCQTEDSPNNQDAMTWFKYSQIFARGRIRTTFCAKLSLVFFFTFSLPYK